jgi:uncharacterized protein (TIGR03000 family)
MFRNAISFGGALLLAGMALVVTPGLAWAQRGGHGGGGHFGGAHFGGARSGGFHGGLYHGGYNYGYPHAYSRPYYGHHHYYPSYGGSYPYYGYTYPYLYNSYPSLWSSPTYNSEYYGSNGYGTPSYPDVSAPRTSASGSYQAYSPPAAAQTNTSARVTVSAPADARLWFDGTPTTASGPVREFTSPPLTPDTKYSYYVKATWNENGHEVTQTETVEVTAGAHVYVHFPTPPRAAEQVTAAKHG